MSTRREFLARSAAVAVVVGFDPSSRRWVPAASAQGCSFDGVPPLRGSLLLDLPSREAVSTDQGNLVSHVPCAVLRPGSVEDVQAMVRYCRRHGIHVAARGQGHTTFGQGLVPGLLIENASLARIHSIGPDGADVDAGVLWKDLAVAAYEQGLTPPVLTGFVGLSIAGTLSVGGVDGNTGHYDDGLQIDRVRELEVVTGTGDVRTCSATRRRDLFEAMLGGLGQCGVITRAKLDLVPAKPMVRTYRISYVDNATFFGDLRLLLGRAEIDGIFNLWMPFGTTLTYQLQCQVLYDPDRPPDDARLLRGLDPLARATTVTTNTSYLDFIQTVDTLVEAHRLTMNWDELVKPWFDVWLSDSQIERYTAEVVAGLTPEDIGPGGFFLIIPQRRSKLTRPFFNVPDADGNGFVYLFDLLTASPTPDPGEAYVQRMLDRNRRLYDKARAAGGTRYPISAIPFGPADWAAEYGDRWADFVRLKKRFDPDGILTPGPGIFT